MTTITATASETHSTPNLDRVTFGLLLAFVAALQLSIAVAQILLTATLIGWASLLVRDRIRPAAPAFFLPLAAYALMTLVSSALSLDPITSLVDSRELLLFSIVPAMYHIASGRRALTVLTVVLSVGAVSAAFGIIQYTVLHYDNLGQRPQGTLGHYMTYSGLLMLVIGVAVARLVLSTRDRAWPALVMPALVVALALTFTRSAWVGACAAVGLLFILRDFRLMALLPVIVALTFAVAPDRVTDRMMSMFDLQDPTNRDRVAMLRTGTAIIADYPLTGVGPNMVPRVYSEYRDPNAVQETNPHLHNVPMHIAAERGLPAAATWLWFVGFLVLELFRQLRSATNRVPPAAALAAVAAMLTAGLFEYNFGDSEFLMLFLVLVTAPFAASRVQHSDHLHARSTAAGTAHR
jgi:O-antigen ligase